MSLEAPTLQRGERITRFVLKRTSGFTPRAILAEISSRNSIISFINNIFLEQTFQINKNC